MESRTQLDTYLYPEVEGTSIIRLNKEADQAVVYVSLSLDPKVERGWLHALLYIYASFIVRQRVNFIDDPKRSSELEYILAPEYRALHFTFQRRDQFYWEAPYRDKGLTSGIVHLVPDRAAAIGSKKMVFGASHLIVPINDTYLRSLPAILRAYLTYLPELPRAICVVDGEPIGFGFRNRLAPNYVVAASSHLLAHAQGSMNGLVEPEYFRALSSVVDQCSKLELPEDFEVAAMLQPFITGLMVDRGLSNMTY